MRTVRTSGLSVRAVNGLVNAIGEAAWGMTPKQIEQALRATAPPYWADSKTVEPLLLRIKNVGRVTTRELLAWIQAGDQDDALATARDILDGTICECGHLESAHVTEPDECHGEGGDPCVCRHLRPVRFSVERAS